MSDSSSKYVRFGVAIAVIVLSLGYLAYTGGEQSKSYYVTIAELHQQAAQTDKVYYQHLRLSRRGERGDIRRQGASERATQRRGEETMWRVADCAGCSLVW